ncbi:MAG TPA: TolC family protein, partial [Marinobacter sp.]|nr:TolC family protein [Marinobacter sp.]
MKKEHMSQVLLLIATTGLPLGAAGVWAAESTDAPFANEQEVTINQQQLVRSLISRNGQALFARLQRQVAMGDIDQERSLLQPELFAEGRYTDTEVLNSASDKLSSFQKRDEDIFEEQSADVEAGVKVPVVTGAELVLSWSGTQRENNLISELPGNTADDNEEFVASLNLSIRQPLLKGFGNRVANNRMREAELQRQVVEKEFHEQLLRASSDALKVYWRLHLAATFLEIQQAALDNAVNIMDETAGQVRAGRQPRTALLEAEARVLEGEAAVHAEEQRWRETQNELKT